MYDMQGIYDNVLKHETLKDGTQLIGPPDGFDLHWRRGDKDHIILSDSYDSGMKFSRSTVWFFTITPDGISLKCCKKSIDTDLILAIAGSYNRLMKLIEPYEDGEAV